MDYWKNVPGINDGKKVNEAANETKAAVLDLFKRATKQGLMDSKKQAAFDVVMKMADKVK